MDNYCIAMESESEKKRQVKADFDAAGLKVKFFDGVNGREPLSKENEQLLSLYGKAFGHPSVVGCALSHYRLWCEISERTDAAPYSLICESDVTFAPDFKEKIESCLAETDESFDILYAGSKNFCPEDRSIFRRLCNIFLYGNRQPQTKRISETRYIPDMTFATHCYIVTQEGAKKLIEGLRSRLGEHVDHLMLRVDGLRIQAVYPPLAEQRSLETSASNIATTNTFPISLNHAMNVDIKNGFSASYYMNCPVAEIWGFPINFWTLAFLIVGLIALLCDIPLIYIIFAFIASVLLDIVAAKVMHLNSSQKKLYLVSALFMTLLPTLLYTAYTETELL